MEFWRSVYRYHKCSNTCIIYVCRKLFPQSCLDLGHFFGTIPLLPFSIQVQTTVSDGYTITNRLLGRILKETLTLEAPLHTPKLMEVYNIYASEKYLEMNRNNSYWSNLLYPSYFILYVSSSGFIKWLQSTLPLVEFTKFTKRNKNNWQTEMHVKSWKLGMVPWGMACWNKASGDPNKVSKWLSNASLAKSLITELLHAVFMSSLRCYQEAKPL